MNFYISFMPGQPSPEITTLHHVPLETHVVLMRALVEAMNHDGGQGRASIVRRADKCGERETTPDSPKRARKYLQVNKELIRQNSYNGDRSPRSLSPAVSDGISRSPSCNRGRNRKLVLHFDLRNTVLVADSVTNVHVEQALNAFLTGATWGKEGDGGLWEWYSDTPSIKPPAPGYVTYYKFLERQLVRTPSERTALRLATGDFTSAPIGQIFRQHFDRHLYRLKWNYEWDKSSQQPLTMSGSDGQRYHYILEGVYRLIYHLWETRRDFALVIRTYGLDAANVLSSMSHGLSGNHPGFSRALPLQVNRTPGTIQRPKDDVIVLESFRMASAKELETKLSHERDIYRFLCRSQGISGYIDDFKKWQAHNYNHHSGKPLWIDPHDKKHHHIIFDDNFRALDEDSIVDVRVFDKEETTRAYSLSKTQLSVLEDVCLVQADLLESIDDRDYFLRKVELCEANYARMLKNNSFPG